MKHDFYEVGKVQVLWTWLDGPNRVRWILGCGGKVAEGLAVVQPLLFLFGGGVGVVRDDVFISLVEEGVPLGAEFLEGLGIDQLLKFGLEFFLWGLFVAFGKTDRFVCFATFVPFCTRTEDSECVYVH